MAVVTYTYIVKCLGLLVAGGRYDLEPTEAGVKPVVPEQYRALVAEYLVKREAKDGINGAV